MLGGPESILGPIDLMGDPSESSRPDDQDEDDDGEGGGANTSNELISADGLTMDQLIDEAVTSRGDDIQWDDDLTGNEEQ